METEVRYMTLLAIHRKLPAFRTVLARREETHWLKRISNFPVAGRNPRGRPRKIWEETITEDRRASNITHIDPTDRTAWRRAIKVMKYPIPQSGKMDLNDNEWWLAKITGAASRITHVMNKGAKLGHASQHIQIYYHSGCQPTIYNVML